MSGGVFQRGERVTEAKHPFRRGTITARKKSGARWVYVVLWDGNDHPSGDYGAKAFVARVPKGALSW